MRAADVSVGEEAIERWCGSLKIGPNAFKRDYEFYESSVEKMGQLKEMMLQAKASSKRAEAKRLKEAAEQAEKEAAEEEAKLEAAA